MKQPAALDLMKLGKNIFLTGSPGSGKTYLLNQYTRYLKDHNVIVAITASTGIAATHVQGVTIHSWSGIGIKDSLNETELEHLLKKKVIKQHYKKTKVLIIDEISMLHPHQLDMIDTIARCLLKADEPFGGLQVIVCGDFFQLPPVSSALSPQKRFAFEANAWKKGNFYVCYLQEQHRQGDDPLRTILEDIRSGTAGEQTKIPLRTRYKKEPAGATQATRLYARNVNVEDINACELAKIHEKEKIFHMTSHGVSILVNSLKKSCLAQEILALKIGAEVMFIKNDTGGRYVNGTRGVVIGFDEEEGWPRVRTYDRRIILAIPEAWNYEENDRVQASIEQVPLRLAWAITIHKSQGMTLDAAEIDLGDVFELGMGYVALSRVRRLDGLKLMNLNELALKVNPKILEYDAVFRQGSEEAFNYLQAFSEKAIKQQQKKTLLKRFEGRAPKTLNKIQRQVKNKEQLKRSNDFVPTHLITLELLKQNLTIPSIAEKRELSVDRVVEHLEKLQRLKQMDLASIDCLKDMMSPSDCDQIIAELKQSEEGRLKPIYEKFEGRYSYAALKVARLFLDL
ncbi:MAG: AAA family ATPase [Gammaproteobacteria bacterium]|nr:AAA family ATPase [Gammaproteobacteria bacterium]